MQRQKHKWERAGSSCAAGNFKNNHLINVKDYEQFISQSYRLFNNARSNNRTASECFSSGDLFDQNIKCLYALGDGQNKPGAIFPLMWMSVKGAPC